MKLLDQEEFGTPAISYKWYQTNYSKISQININEIKEIIKQTSDNT